MVPKEFRKTLCVFAGWVSLIEALVWGGVSIYAVGVYGCSWNYFHVEKGPYAWTMFYVTYLMGSCRGAQGAADLGFVLSPPAAPAQHLHVWLWIYSLISVAWIPACVLLTVAASVEVRGQHGALLYYPWIIISSVIVCVDLAGAIYHLLDIVHSSTPDQYASLTANTTWSGLTMDAPVNDTPWLPSLYITLFFCRFLVLWLLNIFFLYSVYKGCNAVSLYTTKYLQSSQMPEENKKSWKNRFYQGPDPSLFEQSSSHLHRAETLPRDLNTEHQPPVRYRSEDLRPPEGREVDPVEQERSERPRSLFKPGVFDYSGRPIRSDSFRDQWRDSSNAPPIASGVHVPPELNKNEPFSYIAGDQPQKLRRPVSRNDSRSEPPIPRPDYSIADRRAASLEYVPNRFRVPSPKRFQSQSAFNLDSAGRPSNKVAPVPPKKPVYPKSIPEEHEMRYMPQGQQPYYAQQAQNNNYNIDKLY